MRHISNHGMFISEKVGRAIDGTRRGRGDGNIHFEIHRDVGRRKSAEVAGARGRRETEEEGRGRGDCEKFHAG